MSSVPTHSPHHPHRPDGPERLYALDNLRAAMMWLGIVLHVAVIYIAGPSPLPWRDNQTTPTADLLMAFIHAFRMPVFFILAGFFVALLIERRGARAMAHNRLRRLGLPFVVFWPPIFALCGALALAFLHRMARGTWGLDPALMQTAPSAPQGLSTMHLWFLWMLLWLSLGTALAHAALARFAPHAAPCLGRWLAQLGRTPWGIALLTLPLAGIGMLYPDGLLQPNGSFLPPWTEWVHNGLFFGFGLALHGQRATLLAHCVRRWPWYAAAGLVLFFITGALFGAEPRSASGLPPALRLGVALSYNATSWCWSLALIGGFLAHVPRPSNWLSYLADSSYWVYLVHMPMTIGLGALMFGLDWPAGVKMAVNIAATSALSLASYQLLVRHTAVSVLLNGRRHPR